MDIMELGAIGELVGGVAVIATLIYLTVQIREARHEVALAGLRARADTSLEVIRPVVESDLARIWVKLRLVDYGDYGLTEEESMRFGAWCHCWMQAEQARFYTLPASARESSDALHLWWLSTPVCREFWEKNKGFYDDPFVAHMSALGERLKTEGKSREQIMAGEGR